MDFHSISGDQTLPLKCHQSAPNALRNKVFLLPSGFDYHVSFTGLWEQAKLLPRVARYRLSGHVISKQIKENKTPFTLETSKVYVGCALQ